MQTILFGVALQQHFDFSKKSPKFYLTLVVATITLGKKFKKYE